MPKVTLSSTFLISSEYESKKRRLSSTFESESKKAKKISESLYLPHGQDERERESVRPKFFIQIKERILPLETAEEELFLKTVSKKKAFQDVALALNITVSAVYCRWNKLKKRQPMIQLLRKRNYRYFSKETKDAIVAGIIARKSYRLIADELHLTKGQVCTQWICLLKKQNPTIQYLPKFFAPTEREYIILSKEEKSWITSAIACGKSKQAIASELQIPEETVNRQSLKPSKGIRFNPKGNDQNQTAATHPDIQTAATHPDIFQSGVLIELPTEILSASDSAFISDKIEVPEPNYV